MSKPNRRQQILEALALMLQEHPGDRITTARLAAQVGVSEACLLYTSDAADEYQRVLFSGGAGGV